MHGNIVKMSVSCFRSCFAVSNQALDSVLLRLGEKAFSYRVPGNCFKIYIYNTQELSTQDGTVHPHCTAASLPCLAASTAWFFTHVIQPNDVSLCYRGTEKIAIAPFQNVKV